MRRKDYYSKIRNLHKQVIEDIKSLMLEKGKAVIDLAGSEAPHAFIIATALWHNPSPTPMKVFILCSETSEATCL